MRNYVQFSKLVISFLYGLYITSRYRLQAIEYVQVSHN